MPDHHLTGDDAQQAADMAPDVGVEHIASVYAEAFLATTEKAGTSRAILDEFDEFIHDVLDANPRFEQVLSFGLVSHDDKVGILDRVLGSRMSTLLLNFLKVVSRHERLDCLRAIHRQCHSVFDRISGRIPVRLTTATEVSDVMARQIAENLSGMLPGEPMLQCVTDPTLIGGAVVRIGDTVHDGSVANQLEILRQQMIDRSAHEIQSRRDRFRN